MVLVGFVGLKYILSRGIVKSTLIITAALIAVPIVWMIVSEHMASSRIVVIISSFLEDPSSLQKDESIMARFGDIMISLESFLKDFGLPHGFSKFITPEGRIMSGYGTLLHELGVVGLAYIFLIYKKIKSSFNVSYAMAITTVMFSAIQIGIPIFAFLLEFSGRYNADKTEVTLDIKQENKRNTFSISTMKGNTL
jgi:hypothetical protein